MLIESKILNHKIKNKMIKTRGLISLDPFCSKRIWISLLKLTFVTRCTPEIQPDISENWYVQISAQKEREIYKSSRVITNKTEAGNILETRKTLEHSKHSGFAFDDISPRYLVSRSDSTSFDGSIKFCPGDIIRWRVWGLGIIKFVSAVTTIT